MCSIPRPFTPITATHADPKVTFPVKTTFDAVFSVGQNNTPYTRHYFDRTAVAVTEAALPIALAIRADGGWDSLGGYVTLGLLIALLLRGRSGWSRSVVNGLVVAAWAIPETVAGFCWYAFLYKTGTLNALLHHVGIQQNWLYTAPMLAVILANVWRGTAFSMLVYSAALSDVPPELVEAAAMDGASAWQRLRRVSLPLIRRSIVSNLMLITLQTLAAFGLIFVMTGGGPGTASQTTPLYMYEQSFKFYQLGYGTAMALVLLVIGGLFSAIYLRLIRLEDQ